LRRAPKKWQGFSHGSILGNNLVPGKRPVSIRGSTLKGHFRRLFSRAFLAERQDDSLEGLDGAFGHFGGLTDQVRCDNASLWPHSRFSALGQGWAPPRMAR
jgi:CRISPR/Cas system CSM-associated protein Csm3 (group 7 of RAMP superfamily)